MIRKHRPRVIFRVNYGAFNFSPIQVDTKYVELIHGLMMITGSDILQRTNNRLNVFDQFSF